MILPVRPCIFASQWKRWLRIQPPIAHAKYWSHGHFGASLCSHKLISFAIQPQLVVLPSGETKRPRMHQVSSHQPKHQTALWFHATRSCLLGLGRLSAGCAIFFWWTARHTCSLQVDGFFAWPQPSRSKLQHPAANLTTEPAPIQLTPCAKDPAFSKVARGWRNWHDWVVCDCLLRPAAMPSQPSNCLHISSLSATSCRFAACCRLGDLGNDAGESNLFPIGCPWSKLRWLIPTLPHRVWSQIHSLPSCCTSLRPNPIDENFQMPQP